MKRLAIVVLLLAALAGGIVLLARPGAEASPDVTITVNSQGDEITADDDVLTLREAMMLATGDHLLTALSQAECDQVSTALWGPPCHAPPAPPPTSGLEPTPPTPSSSTPASFRQGPSTRSSWAPPCLSWTPAMTAWTARRPGTAPRTGS